MAAVDRVGRGRGAAGSGRVDVGAALLEVSAGAVGAQGGLAAPDLAAIGADVEGQASRHVLASGQVGLDVVGQRARRDLEIEDGVLSRGGGVGDGRVDHEQTRHVIHPIAGRAAAKRAGHIAIGVDADRRRTTVGEFQHVHRAAVGA